MTKHITIEPEERIDFINHIKRERYYWSHLSTQEILKMNDVLSEGGDLSDPVIKSFFEWKEKQV